MNRWLVALGLLAIVWTGSFGIAYWVVEWRNDNSAIDPESCEAAVSFFEAVDSLVADGESIGISGFLLEDTPLKNAWNQAFANMVDQCGHFEK